MVVWQAAASSPLLLGAVRCLGCLLGGSPWLSGTSGAWVGASWRKAVPGPAFLFKRLVGGKEPLLREDPGKLRVGAPGLVGRLAGAAWQTKPGAPSVGMVPSPFPLPLP